MPQDGARQIAYSARTTPAEQRLMMRQIDRRTTRRFFWAVLVIPALAAACASATIDRAAAQAPAFAGRTTLLMVDDVNCVYCRRWDRDVAPGYAKSAEGRFAPLTRLRRGDARLAGIPGLAYTPTFVLFVEGREMGRIVGYPGADFFWAELSAMIQRGGLAPADRPAEQRADVGQPPSRPALR